MDKKCEACEFLNAEDDGSQILLTDSWRAVIGNNHAYLGRAYVTLRTHKGSLSELNDQEWADFRQVVQTLEKAYKQAFGATPLNWGCYMNLAFRTEPNNPHVHWHIYPRYKVAPVINGITFDDPQYGNFYDNSLEKIVDAKTVQIIAAKLRDNL